MKSLLIPLLFLGALLRAQPPAAPVNLDIQAISLGDQEINDLCIPGEKGWVPLRAPATFFLEAIPYKGPNPLPLALRVTSAEGQVTYAPLAEVALPVTEGGILLLLHSHLTPEGKPGLSASAMVLEDQSFPPGSYLLINQTPRSIGLILGGQSVVLKPRESRNVKPGGNGNRPLPVQFMFSDDTTRESLVTTTWFHNDRSREFVFFTPEGPALRLKSLSLLPAP